MAQKSDQAQQTPSSRDYILVRGARANNLKNIDVDIPKDKLTVITGLSGSGKSSLAFDTIYAEGQRRYVESLSSYARQFLGLMEKPDVDLIEGLAPAISIDQKTAGHNPRSTVGTVTEIYDYLRLLYARIGHPRSPETGARLQKQSIDQIVDDVLSYPEKYSQAEAKIQVLAPLVKSRKGTYEELFTRLMAQGFVRVRVNDQVFSLEEEIKLDRYKQHNIELIVDRLVITPDKKNDPDFVKRLTDSIEQAINLGEGEIYINRIDEAQDIFYSENLVDPATGKSFPEIEPHSFSFNSPHGACEKCSGLGSIKEIDPSAIYNPRLTLAEGAIYPWSRMADNPDSWRMSMLEAVAEVEGFSMKTPLRELSPDQLQLILYGNNKKYKMKYTAQHSGMEKEYDSVFEGVIPQLMRRYHETDSDYVRQEIEQYMNELECPVCKGARLRKESLAVTMAGKNILDATSMPIDQLFDWMQALTEKRVVETTQPSTLYSIFGFNPVDVSEDLPTDQELEIGRQVFKEILMRLRFLTSVGLNYLSLSRKANTLSGGESQRIRLASQIGTGLTGVLYVLDEPSIGLHQRDNDRLISTLKELRDLGNTVLVVEHDEDTILVADYVIDIGPGAGEHGGQVIFAGTPEELIEKTNGNEQSLTSAYLSGEKMISRKAIAAELASLNIKPNGKQSAKNELLRFAGITHNNLKNVEIEIPLGKFVSVTGVSGSGKSSLVNDVVYRALARLINGSKEPAGAYTTLRGQESLDKLVNIDQSPIGRTPRSNPATYTGVFTDIRNLFAATQESKTRGYLPGRFSFNVKGGRCENCQGDGLIKIEMQFLPDVYVTCDICHGKRYNRETLQIDYKGKNIAEVLEMTVEEASGFFENIPSIAPKLQTLRDVGLGYIRVGQSSTTLSGGEAQRVKLATELAKRQTGNTLYILDEPTTGLHFDDVRKLLVVLHGLVSKGNTVLVIEHNLDVIKTSDWIIDLGPEGGDGGGQIIAIGTPEEVAEIPESYTGQWIAKVFERDLARSKA
jgi:excinuclease ABC subunit A